MPSGVDSERLSIQFVDGAWLLHGEVTAADADLLLHWLDGLRTSNSPITLELHDLEIADAQGASTMVEVIRALLQLTPRLSVVHAPQVLAHLLYRIGILEGTEQLVLIEPRQEEPYG